MFFFLYKFLDESSGEPIELTTDDLTAMENAANGVRLAAKIVDAPCSEMNVDHFLEVIIIYIYSRQMYCRDKTFQ